jgi:ABC-2 type transport system permease protein
MNLAVLVLDLRIRRVATVLWWVSAVALVMIYLAIYPTIKDAQGIDELVAQLPEAIRAAFAPGDYTSPAGYLESEVFSGLMPVILLVLAIGRGAASLAGEEEMGRLDIVMSQPVRRHEVYLAKTVSLAIVLAVVVVGGVFLPILILGPSFSITIGVAELMAACIQLFVFALLAGVIAEAAGAATGRKGIAIAVPSGIFALGFLINTIGRSVSWMVDLRPLTPWRWYNENQPLTNGLAGMEVGVLLGSIAVVVIVGQVLFSRRDLRV